MKLARNFVRIISLLLVIAVTSQQIVAAVPMEIPQSDSARDKLTQKLQELRTILNEQADRLTDPAVLKNIMNVLRIALVLGAFATVGYKAYKKTFGTPQASMQGKPTPPAFPSQEKPMIPPPSYNTTMFFRKIENLLPQSIGYLDFVIPQLEGQYGKAQLVRMHGSSLISAAINAKELNTFNKVELIRWLKNYGITPTKGDKDQAQQTGDAVIMDAVIQ